MVKVKGAYKQGKMKEFLKSLHVVSDVKALGTQTEGRTDKVRPTGRPAGRPNTTDYIKQYAIHMDQKLRTVSSLCV